MHLNQKNAGRFDVPFKNSPPKKILIINIFGIGDVLFTTPLISNLKAKYPDLYIGYLCNKRTASVLERNPGVDRIFVYDRDEFYQYAVITVLYYQT